MDAEDEKHTLERIESKIALYPDFPKAGILFRDIMPLLASPSVFGSLLKITLNRLKGHKFDVILGIESRGFLLGPLLSQSLEIPFAPIRKAGKLPGKLHSVSYELEYGHDVLEVQQDSVPHGSKCLIVDDLLATGGTMQASKKLVEQSGSNVAVCSVIIELKDLKGRAKLQDTPLITLFSY